jgi:hypothetical protein
MMWRRWAVLGIWALRRLSCFLDKLRLRLVSGAEKLLNNHVRCGIAARQQNTAMDASACGTCDLPVERGDVASLDSVRKSSGAIGSPIDSSADDVEG